VSSERAFLFFFIFCSYIIVELSYDQQLRRLTHDMRFESQNTDTRNTSRRTLYVQFLSFSGLTHGAIPAPQTTQQQHNNNTTDTSV
jgi:hypothetical protein